jgi:hypothetical protein
MGVLADLLGSKNCRRSMGAASVSPKTTSALITLLGAPMETLYMLFQIVLLAVLGLSILFANQCDHEM